jgi:hypothetical protein
MLLFTFILALIKRNDVQKYLIEKIDLGIFLP